MKGGNGGVVCRSFRLTGAFLALQGAAQGADVEFVPVQTTVRMVHACMPNRVAHFSKSVVRWRPAARRRRMCWVMAANLIFGSSRFLKLSLWLRQSEMVQPVCSATTSHGSSIVPASCAAVWQQPRLAHAVKCRTSEASVAGLAWVTGALAFNLEAGCSVKTLVPGGNGILVLLLPLSMVFKQWWDL